MNGIETQWSTQSSIDAMNNRRDEANSWNTGLYVMYVVAVTYYHREKCTI